MDERETTRKLLEAWNDRDWDTIRNSLHPDYQYTGPNGEQAHGIEKGLAAGWKVHAAGLPDGRIQLKAIYSDGEVAIAEFTVRGTHNGTWAGIPPTGKNVKATFATS